MNHIEGVKGNAQPRDQRVVTPGQKEQRDHIRNGQHPGPHAELPVRLFMSGVPVDAHQSQREVARQIRRQQHRLESTGERAQIYRLGQAELAIVSFPPDGRVQQMLLEPGVRLVGNGEVALTSVVERDQLAQIPHDKGHEMVDEKQHDDGAKGDLQVGVEPLIRGPAKGFFLASAMLASSSSGLRGVARCRVLGAAGIVILPLRRPGLSQQDTQQQGDDGVDHDAPGHTQCDGRDREGS